eukprot:scaffold220622_cov51-Attheya_sp.AAC.1
MENQDEKERLHDHKMKVLYDCQFHINMSYIPFSRESRSFSAFLPARITAVNFDYNHELSTVSHRKAMRRSSHQLQWHSLTFHLGD